VNTYWPVDRFLANATASNGVYTAQRSTTVPNGFSNALAITVTTPSTPSASHQYSFDQRIEGFNIADLGFGTASASSVTLSFWVRSSLTGTFAGGVSNNAGDRSYVFTYTVNSANTYEYKTVTIPGDTTGTWLTNNGIGFRVIFDLGAGSSFQATANSWVGSYAYATSGSVKTISTSGATFYITGVQLEAGTVATPFERRDYGRELIMCQRYFQKTYGISGDYVTIGGAGVVVNGTAAVRLQIPMFVSMRSAPTADLLSTAVYDVGALPNVTSIQAIHSSPNSYSLDVGCSGGGLTGGRPAIFLINPGTTNYVSLAAEL